MGIEPKESDLPMEIDSLTVESQLALEIYRYLPDRWEGMSGSYLGKDLNILPFLFKQYKVEEDESSHIFFLIQYIDGCVAKRMQVKREQSEQLSEAKSKWQEKG